MHISIRDTDIGCGAMAGEGPLAMAEDLAEDEVDAIAGEYLGRRIQPSAMLQFPCKFSTHRVDGGRVESLETACVVMPIRRLWG